MKLRFDEKGLIPAIIQDAQTQSVLMLGYMNEASIAKTQESGKVCFYSRSKQRLWTKGETSGNFLQLVSMRSDCDSDALLIRAIPKGPTCHTGTDTCWSEENKAKFGFFTQLEGIINDRLMSDADDSYVAKMFKKGRPKLAQKVGEEAVETVIEAVAGDREAFMEEFSDLFFHMLMLLRSMDYKLEDVSDFLESRHKEKVSKANTESNKS